EARQESGHATPGGVGASRALIVGSSREAAAAAARAYLEKTFAMYRAWAMQESTMMDLQLSFDVPLESWAICGSPADCLETVARAGAMGLDRIGFTIYSLPRETKARIDYLQMIAEDILRPAGAMGLDRIGFTIYSLPRETKARIDYLQMIAEDILRPAGAIAP